MMNIVMTVAWLLGVPFCLAIIAVQTGEWWLFVVCCCIIVVGVVRTFKLAMASLLAGK